MKKGPAIFLQSVLALIGIVAFILMVRLPLTEGRAMNLDLLAIYADPFIIYGYLASIPFFIGLYQAFILLGNIGRNNVFSSGSVKALRNIRYCAAAVGGAVVLAAMYIRISFNGNQNDDPAGFIALSIVVTFITIVIATAAAVFEKMLQSAVDMKSENDLTV